MEQVKKKLLKTREVPYEVATFKRLRFYHMFDPNSPKIYDYNVYQFTFVILTAIVICLSLYGLLGFVIEMEDTVDDIDLFLIVCVYLQIFLAIFKIIIITYNAEKIWDLLDITHIQFLTNIQSSNDIEIQRSFRRTIIKLANFLCICIITLIVIWSTVPLKINSFNAKSNKEILRYDNILNIRFPVTINVFNGYYFIFYVIEITIIAFVGYSVLIFDTVLIICICYVLIALYKINYQSFAMIGHEKQFQNEREERNIVDDFKAIIFDNQNLYLKLKSYYSIVWPIILCTVAVSSVTIIIFSYSFIMVFMASEISLSLLSKIKVIVPLLYCVIQLNLYCYLIENINNNKDSVTFGMYCCNWTIENLKFKKLLLLTMQMNHSNKLIMKTTPKKFINLNFFANVMMMCYNIVSVMLKTT